MLNSYRQHQRKTLGKIETINLPRYPSRSAKCATRRSPLASRHAIVTMYFYFILIRNGKKKTVVACNIIHQEAEFNVIAAMITVWVRK